MSCSHLKLVKLFIPVALIVFWSSCRSDDPEYDVPESPALVTLSVSAARSGPSSPAALLPADQDKISSVYVLQFTSGSGGGPAASEKLLYVAEGKWNGTKRKYEATLLKSGSSRDLYRVVILANIDGGFLYTLYGKTYREIQQLCLSSTISGGPLSFDPAAGIPMFGVARRNVPFEVGAGTDIGEVQLLRSVARVDVGIGLYNETSEEWERNGVDFNMTDIQVWKAGQRYAWMPSADNYSYDAAGYPSVAAASPVAGDLSASPWVYAGSDISSSLYCRNTIFLPETDLSGHVFDADHTNRPAIIVGGYYPRSSGTKSWYRIDFTTSATSSSATSIDLDILRNHHYRFTITRVGDVGYGTAAGAYNGRPERISFRATVDPWKAGVTAAPPGMVGGRMFYGKLNGETTEDVVVGRVKAKTTIWEGRMRFTYGYNYNNFYNEGLNYYAQMGGPENYNGDLYPYAKGGENGRFSALNTEGVYPKLMVSNDVYALDGSDAIVWKDTANQVLTAFNLCRNYEGLGYMDWRLPRLSELALMYLNRFSLQSEIGFEPFSGVYWSGCEYTDTEAESLNRASDAWALDFSGTTTATVFVHRPKWTLLKVRCVRQL